LIVRTLESVVGRVTVLRTGRPRDRGSIFDRSLNFSLLYAIQAGSGANTPSY